MRRSLFGIIPVLGCKTVFVILTIFCSSGLSADFSLRPVSESELYGKGNEYEKQSYLDLQLGGGEGKIYHLDFSDSFTEKEPFVTNVFSGYFTVITKKPFKLHLSGKSIFNFEPNILAAINSYEKSAMILLPYGRAINGAVLSGNSGFIGEMIEEINKFTNTQSALLFAITPNLDMDTFVHEREHAHQRNPEHPVALYVAEISKIVTAEDLTRFDKFAREFAAYVVQRKYLETAKKGDVHQIADDADSYKIEKVDFGTYYNAELEQIDISMKKYSESMNNVLMKMSPKYDLEQMCKLKTLTRNLLENEFYPLDSMLPQLNLIQCK